MRPRAATFLALALIATQPALAHAMLEHASPAAGTALRTSPRAVVLTFSEGLEPAFSKVSVSDAKNHDVSSGKATINGTVISAALNSLKPGSYRVHWHAVSLDMHRTEGSFTFTVTP